MTRLDQLTVVPLAGVSVEDAYAWGVETGNFLALVLSGRAAGVHVFHAGNIGMIEMICVENALQLDVLSSNHQACQIKVSRSGQGKKP